MKIEILAIHMITWVYISALHRYASITSLWQSTICRIRYLCNVFVSASTPNASFLVRWQNIIDVIVEDAGFKESNSELLW